MSSYLLPIDLSGLVSLNPSFTEGDVTCILPPQSEAVYLYTFHIICLCLLCFNSKYNLADCLLGRLYNFLNCSCFPPHTLILKLSRDQKTLQPLLYELSHFKETYFRAIKRLGMWYRWSKVATFPFLKYYSVCHQFHGIHAFSSSYSSVSVISYSYNLGDFVKDFYELSMILISYEFELNLGIK